MPFTSSPAWAELQDASRKLPHLSQHITPESIKQDVIQCEGVSFHYAATPITKAVQAAFQNLADDLDVVKKYHALRDGQPVNHSENRAVLHHQTRAKSDRGFYKEQQHAFSSFAEQVRSGKITSSKGHPFTTVVQVGIGGSELGPRCVIHALKHQYPMPMSVHFMPNIDPDASLHLLESIPFEQTLFLIVSKSGTTCETQSNLNLILSYGQSLGFELEDVYRHIVLVLSGDSLFPHRVTPLAQFYMNDAIGGRFSVTSAAGGVLICLAFGPDVFEAFLNGAAKMDDMALSESVQANIPLFFSLMRLWQEQCLGYNGLVLCPYLQALRYWVDYVQQLECESNGKTVDISGRPISYKTGYPIWGGVGTNVQHSFFQMLHQGSSIIPVQFIAVKKGQHPNTPLSNKPYSILLDNVAAQIHGLAFGRKGTSPFDEFAGNRPSTLIVLDQLSAFHVGQLVSLYENTVMFEGFLLGINSFDQPGVQLGKDLAKQLDTRDATDELVGLRALLSS